MARQAQRYDDKTQTLWIYHEYDDPDTLVPSEQLQDHSRQVRAGKLDDGTPLKHVNYIFGHVDTAEYNHHALAFSRLGTYLGTLDAPKLFDADAPSFETKDDFGIK